MRLYIPLITALLSLGSAPCFAQTTEYDIEIVIFEDLSNRYLESEKWPRIEHALAPVDNTTGAIIEQALDLKTNNQADDKAINITDNKLRMLVSYARKLKKSSRYNVLVHKAWRQTGLDAASAIDIEINSIGQNNNAATSGKSANQGVADPEADQAEELISSISGSVKITLGRYLHIYTDLIYKKPASYQSAAPVSLQDNRYSEFLIKTHRRMRSKELHYLDHPLVGILVMALPVKTVEQEQAQTSKQ